MARSDSLPEGYATLVAIERGAPNYNAWLGSRLRAHLGNRVLEVGAGIGTITREILPDRELVIALEAEQAYADHLTKVFSRDRPRVRVLHSSVENTEWASLAAEHIDSVLLSNVLEHIEDDASATRNFRMVLAPGGTIVILVPALPILFGTLDEAVGHYRRYTRDSLRSCNRRKRLPHRAPGMDEPARCPWLAAEWTPLETSRNSSPPAPRL